MIGAIDRQIGRALAGLRQAFRGVLSRVDTSAPVALVQLQGVAGEVLQDRELFQDYGLTSSPPAGAMAVVLPLGGKSGHMVVIATEHGRYRLRGLASGEVALYDDLGQRVHLTRAGIVIDGAGLPVTIKNTPQVDVDSPEVNMTGALKVAGKITGSGGLAISGGEGVTVSGNIASTGAITNNGRAIDSTHTHSGVQPGSGSSGAPN